MFDVKRREFITIWGCGRCECRTPQADQKSLNE